MKIIKKSNDVLTNLAKTNEKQKLILFLTPPLEKKLNNNNL